MGITQEQVNEIEEFRLSLSKEDEWLFWNVCVATKTEIAVTYEHKYETMQRWDTIYDFYTKEDE